MQNENFMQVKNAFLKVIQFFNFINPTLEN